MNNSGEGDRIKQLAAQHGIELDPNIDYNSDPSSGWNTHVDAAPEQTPDYGNSGLVTRITRGTEDVTGREESHDISQMFESPEEGEQFSGVISDRIQNEVQQLDAEAKAPMLGQIAQMGDQAAMDEGFRRYWEEIPEGDSLGYSIPPSLIDSLKPIFGDDLSVDTIAAYLKYNNLSQQDLNRVSQVLLGNVAPPASNNLPAPHSQQPSNFSYDEDDDDDYGEVAAYSTAPATQDRGVDVEATENAISDAVYGLAQRVGTADIDYLYDAIGQMYKQMSPQQQAEMDVNPARGVSRIIQQLESGWNQKRQQAKQQKTKFTNSSVNNKLYSWKKLQSLPQDRYQAAMKKLENQYGANWTQHVDFTR